MKNRKRLVSILAGIMAAVMLLTLILGLLPTRVSAASSAEIKKQIAALNEQKAEIREQMADVKSQYEANEDEIANIVAQKNVIDQEIGLLKAEILITNEEISAYSVLIADKQDELDNAQARYEELNAQNKERVRTMEEDGAVSYWEVLFKANSFSDLLDRLNMVEEIAASDQRRLKELDEAAKNVEAAQTELEAEKESLESTKEELDKTQAELDVKRAEADELIGQLLDKAEELQALHEGFEMEEEELMQEIAQKEKEYNEAKHQEWLAYMATYTTVPPETTAPPTTGSTNNSTSSNTGNGSSNEATNSGGAVSNAAWLRPCSYVMISSPFGYRKSPTAGASSYHQGVDLAGPEGTPIYATRSGVVTVARYSSSAGYYVTINHGDGFSSIYMHMTNYVVSAGSAVSAGQLIGYMGSTGISTGSHLHFGIAYNGAYVNPAAYVAL